MLTIDDSFDRDIKGKGYDDLAHDYCGRYQVVDDYG